MTRDNTKPTSKDRYWPHFAAGWNGDERTPIPCADCGFDAWVGLGQRDPRGVNVAHVVDPSRQGWRDNVTITCRACNIDHGHRPQPHLAPLPYTLAARDASRAYVRAAHERTGAEHARRVAARRARMP